MLTLLPEGLPPPPAAMPSPFTELEPHPLAQHAARCLQQELAAHPTWPEGKMFGVLVVADAAGRLGFVRAFSGQWEGRFHHHGYAPPLFDERARTAVEVPGERAVKALTARVEQHRAVLEPWEQQLHERLTRDASDAASLRALHRQRKAERRAARERVPADDFAARHALDQQSRADVAEWRRFEADAQAGADGLTLKVKRARRRLSALERLRSFVSRRLMERIFDTYAVPNARGQVRPLRECYLPQLPPSGAGDCAAPKLLAYAFAHRLRPLALAEFWWGPPLNGARTPGSWAKSCASKCGPLLPVMLEGLEVAVPQRFKPPQVAAAALDVVFCDERLLVIDKPAGLLSVPGTDVAVTDSALARLRERWPNAQLVHRLDMDTSGLLVAALDEEAFVSLQAQFIARTVQKRYVALLERRPPSESGTVDLPLRVDLDDRPRQLHDPVHGKLALTDYQVLRHEGGRVRVHLWPRTGRTHQLRVHAAHRLGLQAPIVGDRLYGTPGERLMLHAESLMFTHPSTGQALRLERGAPF